mmetsp:Transcript_43634/g.98162  ORF Transcript_43634/g.98162 Transcript_43634/m.98162 type:complete len:96 (-) Transcript_43634:101-388(-)
MKAEAVDSSGYRILKELERKSLSFTAAEYIMTLWFYSSFHSVGVWKFCKWEQATGHVAVNQLPTLALPGTARMVAVTLPPRISPSTSSQTCCNMW